MASRRATTRHASHGRILLRLPWYLVLGLAALAALLTFAGLYCLPRTASLHLWPLRAGQLLLPPPLLLSATGASLWLLFGVIGAIQSWRHRQLRRQLVRRATNLAAIQALSWQQFELLIGQLYRQHGYYVTEMGLGGADGGIDLVAQKWGSGEKVIVQCKHYRATAVGVPVVRELYGLLYHHQATSAAQAFAQSKPLTLIGADQLLGALHAGRRAAA
ncbi:restriction endonuclease (plasmid) [Hymenobacter sp. BRD128]|uniref:restriction endonuclease n=1 Tax=Hymenobacter sp. BRD128 TaxID=2675878 RepID=UPI001564CA48|nr:restriction endonuclease [Hymenobacter sp. BRD128]QKG59113.1 restriction endonuclease [Hymenobacter sp. BRD128]